LQIESQSRGNTAGREAPYGKAICRSALMWLEDGTQELEYWRRDRRSTARHAKACKRHAQHRLVQCGLRPALAVVRTRNHDFGNSALARIGEPGDFVESRLMQIAPRRGMCDERFDLVHEIKLVRLAARQRLRVSRRMLFTPVERPAWAFPVTDKAQPPTKADDQRHKSCCSLATPGR